jgi:hypothetical protein
VNGCSRCLGGSVCAEVPQRAGKVEDGGVHIGRLPVGMPVEIMGSRIPQGRGTGGWGD